MRSNPAGRVQERWFHRAGCRRYFGAERDTRDNTVFSTWRLGHEGSGVEA
jgi:heterotetrameric sarcosine oxidase delta subunit